MFYADAQMSSIKRIVPRLTSMAFKMKFNELVSEIKPVSVDCTILTFNSVPTHPFKSLKVQDIDERTTYK